jgi:hypothetical protein
VAHLLMLLLMPLLQVFLLEGENRKLVRALVREVGEEVPLAKVVDEGSDWKGRREQIIHLKDTIRQLRDAAAAGSSTAVGSAAGLPAVVTGSLAKHESAHRSVIGKLNKERGAEFERMAGELATAQREKEQLRLQYAGAASRRKVLEAEVSCFRAALLADRYTALQPFQAIASSSVQHPHVHVAAATNDSG